MSAPFVSSASRALDLVSGSLADGRPANFLGEGTPITYVPQVERGLQLEPHEQARRIAGIGMDRALAHTALKVASIQVDPVLQMNETAALLEAIVVDARLNGPPRDLGIVVQGKDGSSTGQSDAEEGGR